MKKEVKKVSREVTVVNYVREVVRQIKNEVRKEGGSRISASCEEGL